MSQPAEKTGLHLVEPDSGRLLESWGEIATYCNRDERTVRRWETEEGLPVHRHHHNKQASVYAFSDELDDWLKRREPRPNNRMKPENPSPARTRRWWLAALLIALLALAAYFAWQWISPLPEPLAIAVLPFKNITGDPDKDYFSDGMTEALITELGKISSLRVISLQSTRIFKKTDKPLLEIAAILNVDFIVEGSILQVDDEVRITAQLIRAEPEQHLWAQNYVRQLEEIFKLQNQIARDIAQEVQITLTPKEEACLAPDPSISPQALDVYLKGRRQWHKFTHEGFQRATNRFEETIRLAPNFSDAYSGLAMTYNMRGSWWGDLPPMEAFPLAKNSAQRALELDSCNGEAQGVLAWATFVFDWDWPAAEIEFQKALASNPNSHYLHQSYSNYLRWNRMPEEALVHGERSLLINPLSPINLAEVALQYAAAGNLQLAEEKARAAIELDPTSPVGYSSLGILLRNQGKFEESIRVLQQAADLPQKTGPVLRTLGTVYVLAGRESDARAMIVELEKLPHPPSQYIGLLHANLGDVEEAIYYFEKSYEERDPQMVWVKGRATVKLPPNFQHIETIRSDPRWQAVYRKMNFPED